MPALIRDSQRSGPEATVIGGKVGRSRISIAARAEGPSSDRSTNCLMVDIFRASVILNWMSLLMPINATPNSMCRCCKRVSFGIGD
jgi:hypothetical protein